MPETATRRGRPKGSGIDDSTRLVAIARLLASNPDMKPTTAIRTLGVSDPSIIRRLRDKYAEVRQSLASELVNAEAEPQVAAEAEPLPVAAMAATTDGRPKRVRAAAAEARTASRRVAEPASPLPPVTFAPAERRTRTPVAKPARARTSTTKSTAQSTAASESTTASASTTTAPTASTRRSKSTTPNKTAAAAPAPIATEPPAALEARVAGTSTAHSETALVTAAVSAAPASAPATDAASTTTTLDRPATPRQPVADDLFASMFGLGVAATTSALAAQLKFADNFARTPYVKLVLRQQLAFNEWALRLVAPAPRPARRNAG